MNPLRKKRHEAGLLTIGEIARELGILSSRVRFYTRLGLLREAARTRGGYRLYKKEEAISALKMVLELKKKGMPLEEIKTVLKAEIAPPPTSVFKQYPVKFAYLFGSAAKGEEGVLSDTDIAVFLDEEISESRRFDMRLKLIGEMKRVYRTDNIDLVVLNDSPLLLSYQVTAHGKILYSSDERARIRFEARIMSSYFDQQYYYRRHAETTISRVAAEGIL